MTNSVDPGAHQEVSPADCARAVEVSAETSREPLDGRHHNGDEGLHGGILVRALESLDDRYVLRARGGTTKLACAQERTRSERPRCLEHTAARTEIPM